MNFAVAPKIIPKEDIFSAEEYSIRLVAEKIFFRTVTCVRNAKTSLPNISRYETLALKNLQQNSNMDTLQEDKGNSTSRLRFSRLYFLI